MRVIARPAFEAAKKKFPNAADLLDATYRALKHGKFKTPLEMKKVFASLDKMKHKPGHWVIDINGNHIRLIAFIEFKRGEFYVRHIVSHAEYDKLIEEYKRGKR